MSLRLRLIVAFFLVRCPARRVEREIARFRSGREPFDDATMMVVNVGQPVAQAGRPFAS